MRTATLDLNSRGSFVDDLNSIPGIVMCRDALLHRSHEIQPAYFDSEKRSSSSFFHLFFFFEEYGTCLQLELSDLAIFVGRTYYATTYPPTAAVAFTGGSSAVEQRTVKCASAAILWSGVQISLSGLFVVTACCIGWRYRPEQGPCLTVIPR